MTSAAVKTATLSSAPISGSSAHSGTGTVEAVYTATIVTTKDWLVLSDFDSVKYVHAVTTADGVDAAAYVDSTTENKVFITGTGAIAVLAIGTPDTD